MPDRRIAVTTIGKIAQEALAQAHQASVVGMTSRGVFLRLTNRKVIFLSFEPYRGPLTLNLQEDSSCSMQLSRGAIASLYSHCIFFPAIGLSLLTSQAETWRAPMLPDICLPPDQRIARLRSIMRLADLDHATSQLAALLPALMGIHERSAPSGDELFNRVVRLQQARQEDQFSTVADILKTFIGLGAGLTPAGDDLVIGFLLAANRWGDRLFPGLDVATLNKETQTDASRHTSTLSANLVECASLGQADERLILALDGIVTGQPDAGACVAALAAWGHTSGFDALAGMALFLTTSPLTS